jgi:glucosyl-3-phosphoglycerate synthase
MPTMPDIPNAEIQDWFGRRTFGASRMEASRLAELKERRGERVSVCLPALNEASTIGHICSVVRVRLMDEVSLVDELIVVDSGSTDDTMEVAREAGATVHRTSNVLPRYGRGRRGKGEALWKSLAVSTGDIVVWVDSDTRNFAADFITGLIEPLLEEPGIGFVKAYYNRPIATQEGQLLQAGGARVTELLVRPVLNLLYPALAGVVQPLSGEYAGRREILESIPFLSGYAVDIGLLLDITERHGIDAIAQVDLGTRVHRNRDIPSLGRMAFEVLQAMLMRIEQAGGIKLPDDLPDVLVQFGSGDPTPSAVPMAIEVDELPPLREVLTGE